jgi:TRAP-type mannitol/chloroaromatic compound transport system permease large subunit
MLAPPMQTAFLSPPMAMACYYLKGIAPPRITLVQIFNGCYPFLALIVVAMALVYAFPELVYWLPNQLYGSR